MMMRRPGIFLLVLGAALTGCAGNAPDNPDNPESVQTTDPGAPTVTLEVKGMS
jgi:hypothetical protein